MRCVLLSPVLLLMAACGTAQEPSTRRSVPGATTSGGAGDVVGGIGSSGTGLLIGGGLDGGSDEAEESDYDGPHPCLNLQCRQTTCTLGNCTEKACTNGAKTTVRGTVMDPAGKVPLYNVVVYVPNTPVKPFTPGASCDRCASSVKNPVASALTDTKGQFVLEDVPVGADVPLVLQVGKWRRQLTIPNVAACAETALTDANQMRLPRNQSEGDIPLIALTTGGADTLECLPLRMGIDPAEFTTENGKGRIHLYAGYDNPDKSGSYWAPAGKQFAANLNAGAVLTPAQTLWGDVKHLSAYDLVIMSCEGALNTEQKPAAALQAMYDYESTGGRVFASHWHRYWFSDGPAPVPQIGAWQDWEKPDPYPDSPTSAKIDTSFPKGAALADWIVSVGASKVRGEFQLYQGRDNIHSVNGSMAQQWVTIPAIDKAAAAGQPTAVEYLSYNAPLQVSDDKVCGRAVFSDLHVSAASRSSGDAPGEPFPSGCKMADLTAQEKALEFLLFDLSSCVQNDKLPPVPPPPAVIK
jgi:hypothetical protein